MVRASNSGVSAFIDPTGRVVASLSYGAVGILAHSLNLRHDLTPYVRFGNWIILPCTLFVAVPVEHREPAEKVKRRVSLRGSGRLTWTTCIG